MRAVALALLSVAMLAVPGAVNAAGSAKPDGLIEANPSCSCNPSKGNNIYNTTGLNQTAKVTYIGAALGMGLKVNFGVTIQNDGPASGRFKVHAPSSSWKVTYFHGSMNITSAVVAGTYQTSTLAPGASFAITVKVDLDSMDADSSSRLITITSSTDSTKKDAVKLKMKHGSCGC